MSPESTEIATALIGLAGVTVTATLGYMSTRLLKLRKERDLVRIELDFQRRSLDFAAFIEEWSSVYDHIAKLMEETNIDRVLLLRAWNGEIKPKWTTAVLQIRDGKQKPISYIHFDLDDDYVDRLTRLYNHGRIYFVVDQVPDSAIRRVYEAEGVTSSMWALVDRRTYKHRAAITYASFSTHDGEISPEDQTKCGIVAGHLKGVANNFYSRETG